MKHNKMNIIQQVTIFPFSNSIPLGCIITWKLLDNFIFSTKREKGMIIIFKGIIFFLLEMTQRYIDRKKEVQKEGWEILPPKKTKL